MRMTIYQLVTQEIDDIDDIKMLFLLTDLRIEYDMQEHITKLLGKFMFLPFENGVAQFVYLFESLWTERFVCLFPVPWTFLPQLIQNIQYPAECLKFFFACMHLDFDFYTCKITKKSYL